MFRPYLEPQSSSDCDQIHALTTSLAKPHCQGCPFPKPTRPTKFPEPVHLNHQHPHFTSDNRLGCRCGVGGHMCRFQMKQHIQHRCAMF